MEFQTLYHMLQSQLIIINHCLRVYVCLRHLVSRNWFPLLGELLCTWNTWGIADVLALSHKPLWRVWNLCLSSVSLFDVVCYSGGENPQKYR